MQKHETKSKKSNAYTEIRNITEDSEQKQTETKQKANQIYYQQQSTSILSNI